MGLVMNDGTMYIRGAKDGSGFIHIGKMIDGTFCPVIAIPTIGHLRGFIDVCEEYYKEVKAASPVPLVWVEAFSEDE